MLAELRSQVGGCNCNSGFDSITENFLEQHHAWLGCAGMVILHPDLLLSGTRISGSFRCQRQSVLEERFAGSSNDKAVEGTLMHEVFQVSLPDIDALTCMR